MRKLEALMHPLSSTKVNTILKYLIRRKMIEVDLDGNIIWVKGDESNSLTIGDIAKIDEKAKSYFHLDN